MKSGSGPVRSQASDDLVAGHRKHIERWIFGAAHTGGGDERQRLHPLSLLGGKMRRQKAAQREADKMDLVDAKRIEQTDVMHNVIVERIHRRIVTRFAKSGMVGVEDAELVRPRLGEFVAVERARPVQEEQRLALA